MSDPIDRDHLTVTGERPTKTGKFHSITVDEGITVVVNRAFGPKGDDLVGISDVSFDGYPAVTIKLLTEDGREGLVHLSPIHGDRRKEGFTDIEVGARLTLICPVSGELLPKVGSVDDGSGADYYAIYLTPKLSAGEHLHVSDIWGHYHSRIVDDFSLISYWANTERTFTSPLV
jgi:hypothetical protein